MNTHETENFYLNNFSKKIKYLEKWIIAKKLVADNPKNRNSIIKQNTCKDNSLKNDVFRQYRSGELDRLLELGINKLPQYNIDQNINVQTTRQFVDKVIDRQQSTFGSTIDLQLYSNPKKTIPLFELDRKLSVVIKRCNSSFRNLVLEQTNDSLSKIIIKTETSERLKSNFSDQFINQRSVITSVKKHLGCFTSCSPEIRLPSISPISPKISTVVKKKKMILPTQLLNQETIILAPKTIIEIINQCKVINKNLKTINTKYNKKIDFTQRQFDKIKIQIQDGKNNNFLKNDLVFI